MNRNSIKNESKRLWEKKFSEVKRKSQYDANFSQLIDKYGKQARKEAIENLQPWLQILEDRENIGVKPTLLTHLEAGRSCRNCFTACDFS